MNSCLPSRYVCGFASRAFKLSPSRLAMSTNFPDLIFVTCNTWKWAKEQQNYLIISLLTMGENWWQSRPKELSSRTCFPPMCNATSKHTYSWSGFTWPPKYEVTTRLTLGERLDWDPEWRAQKKKGWLQGPRQPRFLLRKEEDPQRTGLPCNGSRYTVTHSHAIPN